MANHGIRDLAFTLDEYRSRVARVQALMAARGLDALLIHDRADVCYLTGIETCYMVAYHAAIVPATGDPILIASDFEMLNALVSAWCDDRIAFPVPADPIATTGRVLRERGWGRGRIGVQPAALTAERYGALRRRLSRAALVDAGPILPAVKVRKSAAEIAYQREAARLTTLGMEAAMAEAAIGRSDQDLAAAAYDAMVRGGSEFMCIDPIVTVGARSGIPHTTCRRTVIRPGDAILVELGACVCRYSSPLMRSLIATPVSPEIRAAADACRDSLNVLLEHLRPGAVAREIAAKARAAWTPLCDELIWHGIYAYSVGIGFPPDWNDAPLCITEDADFVLEPEMVFHATTSLREPATYGVAMSETVLITENGNEVLTGTPRELRVI